MSDQSDQIAKLRREDPAYDKAWRDGLRRMSDEIDQVIAEKVYAKLFGEQRTGDETV
jgi:hypothetical protein